MLDLLYDSLFQTTIIAFFVGVIASLVSTLLSHRLTATAPQTIYQTTVQYNQTFINLTPDKHNSKENNQNKSKKKADDLLVILIKYVLLPMFVVWLYILHCDVVLYWISILALTAISFTLTSVITLLLKKHFTSKEWWWSIASPFIFIVMSLYFIHLAHYGVDRTVIHEVKNLDGDGMIDAFFNWINYVANNLTTYGRFHYIFQVAGLMGLVWLVIENIRFVLKYIALMNQRTEGVFKWLWILILKLSPNNTYKSNFLFSIFISTAVTLFLNGIFAEWSTKLLESFQPQILPVN